MIPIETKENEGIKLSPEGKDVPVLYLSGQAGCGKTFTIRKLIEQDPEFGVLCATTGIASINLGVITINSLLRFFNTESLQDQYVQGRLGKRLHDLATKEHLRNLIVDETSMMHCGQLQVLYDAIAEVNTYADMQDRGRRLGLVLTGDFGQLPPVADKDPKTGKSLPVPWVFDAPAWEHFDNNTLRLTKVWRQADKGFLDVVNAIRAGNGRDGVELLAKIGVRFEGVTVDDFPGTTILPKNDQVDRYNNVAVMRVSGKLVQQKVDRYGIQKSEWRKNIPDWQQFKINSYVMLLSNKYRDGEIEYANGDCGFVKDFDDLNKKFVVELVRNGQEVSVGRIDRVNDQRQEPEGGLEKSADWIPSPVIDKPFKDPLKKRWVLGGVQYFPMRYAWASTVHKVQGLTLDRCQMDFRNGFFGSNNMSYVAISRCRTAEGLRLVGDVDTFVKRVKVDPRVLRWL